jgi:hypothetical protein
MSHVWSKGDVTMRRDSSGAVLLKKGDVEVKLSKLAEQCLQKKTEYMKFDAADLALANVHQQTENFVRGLTQIREAVARGPHKESGKYIASGGRVNDPIELIPEQLRPTVRHAQELAESMVKYFRQMEAKPGVIVQDKDGKRTLAKTPEGNALRMAKDAYHQLMETSLEQQAMSRVPYLGMAA